MPIPKYRRMAKKVASRKRRVGAKRSVKRSKFTGKIGQLAKVRLGTGFPSRVATVHKFCNVANVTSGVAGAFFAFSYSCNGLFSPSLSLGIGGQQPMYFDQFTALYNHYAVTGARLKLTVTPRVIQNVSIRVGVFENDDVTVQPTNMNRVGEQTTGQTYTFPPNATHSHTFYATYKPTKIWGANAMALERLRGTATANPSEITAWTYAIETIGAATQSDMTWTTEIEYNATWTEVKDQAGS